MDYWTGIFCILRGVSGFSGMEWWTGMLEWNDGMDWNDGMVGWNMGSSIAVIGIVVTFTHGKHIHACV